MASFLNTKGNGLGTGQVPDVDPPRPNTLSPANEPITEEALAEVEANGRMVPNGPTLAQESSEELDKALTRRGGRPFIKGNRAAIGRKPKLAMLGIDTAQLDIKDPRYRSCLRRAEFYMKRRSRELAVMFGYVTAGVNGILSTAALQLAASKYLSQLGSELLGVPGGLSQYTELQKTIISLQNSAMRAELAAYELCAKEHAQQKKVGVGDDTPWLESGK